MKQLSFRQDDGPVFIWVLSSEKNEPPQLPMGFWPVLLVLFLIAVIGWHLTSGYEEGAITIEEIEQSLTPEELEAYRNDQSEVDEKFEECIQYILYAREDGKYACRSCPSSMPFVTLKKGEVWYIGHTCQEHIARHARSFLRKHNVLMVANYTGPQEKCHRIELKLIRGYRYLPESQKPEIKLMLPPYNQTDKY